MHGFVRGPSPHPAPLPSLSAARPCAGVTHVGGGFFLLQFCRAGMYDWLRHCPLSARSVVRGRGCKPTRHLAFGARRCVGHVSPMRSLALLLFRYALPLMAVPHHLRSCPCMCPPLLRALALTCCAVPDHRPLVTTHTSIYSDASVLALPSASLILRFDPILWCNHLATQAYRAAINPPAKHLQH